MVPPQGKAHPSDHLTATQAIAAHIKKTITDAESRVTQDAEAMFTTVISFSRSQAVNAAGS